MRISFYFDEDSMAHALLRALTARGVDVASALSEGMIQKADLEHLRHATALNRVLFSFNVGDFHRLHGELLAAGEHHAGIVLGQQWGSTIGDQLRRLLNLSASLSAEQMRDRLEFLSTW